MAEGGREHTTTTTITSVEQESSCRRSPEVVLKLRKPKPEKKVNWTEATIDNEHMNKKKSKCCCIYEKPRKFDDASSDEDDDCNHCRGHKQKCFRQTPDADSSTDPGPSSHLES